MGQGCCGNLTHLTIMDSSHHYLSWEISLPEGRSISVLSEQYETSYLFYLTLSFLCNIICYLISVFVFSLMTLSRATTITHKDWYAIKQRNQTEHKIYFNINITHSSVHFTWCALLSHQKFDNIPLFILPPFWIASNQIFLWD